MKLINSLPRHLEDWSQTSFWTIMVLFALLCSCGNGQSQNIPKNVATIAIRQLEANETNDSKLGVDVKIGLSQPVTALDFGLALHNSTSTIRQSTWYFNDNSVALEERAGRLYAVRQDGKPFDLLSFRAFAGETAISQTYLPLYELNANTRALVLYTGHFWPFDQYGKRMEVRFDLTAIAGNRVEAFGKRATRLEDWQSPYNHPAFIVFSDLSSPIIETMYLHVDDAIPPWILNEIKSIVSLTTIWLKEKIGPAGRQKPTLIFATAPNADAIVDTFRYAGDALPNQIMTVLSGSPWQKASPTGRNILERATVHELIHLWQATIRPAHSDVPSWIHEGAAEAIAAEALVETQRWTRSQERDFTQKARQDCDKGVREERLDRLYKDTHFRTIYACGQILAQIAATDRSGVSVAAFWKDYLTKTRNSGVGYSFESWIGFTRERTSNDELADGLRRFVSTRWSQPGTELDRLAELARRGSTQ